MRNEYFIKRIHEKIDEILAIECEAVRIVIEIKPYSVPTVDYTATGCPIENEDDKPE